MDFWSRLIAGPKASKAKSTAERLTTFKKICNALHQIWRKTPPEEIKNPGLIAHIRACIDKLNDLLRREGRGPSPHPCHAYAASSRLYLTTSNLALLTRNSGVVTSTATLFNILIDSEVDGIVDNRGFARALVDLVSLSVAVGEEGDGRLVELMFGVANNIRLRPEILPAWFHPSRSTTTTGADATQKGATDEGGSPTVVETDAEREEREFAGATRKDDFALFYLLIDHVHHVDRSGDFARTGLLYIIETASRSKDLERWLVESDLATLMATGLGALYSQLSRKLTFPMLDDSPDIVNHSDHAAMENARLPQLGSDMDAFLCYLLFWQDTIEHCKSAEVNKTLLDHFQVLFLQQLLYPSLLESSDVDGGSTSAVLTYLARILESLNQPDLVHRILQFLLASPRFDDSEVTIPNRVEMASSNRKSFDSFSFIETSEASPALFNLVDITLTGLRSRNMQTIVATLRLIAVIIDRHHIFASSLIKTIEDRDASEENRPIGALNAEIQQFISLATTIFDEPRLDQSYANYLSDATAVLEVRNMELPLLNKELLPEPYNKYPLRVDPQDDLLETITNLMESFFTNSVVLNLALTDALTGLASSNLISLDGWLLVIPKHYRYADALEENDEDEDGAPSDALNVERAIQKLKMAYAQPFWSKKHVPPITRVLRRLVKQVEQWRAQVPDFDVLVAARKKLLQNESQPQNQSLSRTSSTSAQPGKQIELPFRGRGKARSAEAKAAASPTQAGNPVQGGAEEGTHDDAPICPGVGEDLLRRLNTPFVVNKVKRPVTPQSIAVRRGLRSRVNTMVPTTRPFERKPTLEDDRKENVPPKTDEASTVGSENTAKEETDQLQIKPADAPKEKEDEQAEEQPVTLGHALTNTILLHEFILELASLIQTRASLFQEVAFVR